MSETRGTDRQRELPGFRGLCEDPRVEWGAGMANKTIAGGLMPGGRLRMEKLSSLATSGRLDLHKEVTHIFQGKEHVEEALFMMRDKPADLIKPVVIW